MILRSCIPRCRFTKTILVRSPILSAVDHVICGSGTRGPIITTYANRPVSSYKDESDPPEKCRTKTRAVIELMRWHKPIGVILALTPSLWALGLASPVTSMFPDLKTVAIFSAGAVVARGMGCTVNDMLDWKYDRLVERTKNRPIACGDISVREALLYLAIQSSVGLSILCLNNIEVIKLGVLCSLMISTYPLFKRITYWPQLMLALTINWGVIMGFAAVQAAEWMSNMHCIAPLYLGSICWTLYYDTIYAHQDKTDDMFIGVKSTALKLGINTKRFLGQTTGMMYTSLAVAGLFSSQMWPYYLSIASAGAYQSYQIVNLDLKDKEDCWTAFDRQKYIGMTILGGVLASIALKARGDEENLKNNKSCDDDGC